MSRLKEFYNSDVAPALMKKFNYKSPMQIPRLEKVIINCCESDAKDNAKVIVAGANIVSKHNKARRQGENSSIVKTEGAIYASKVQLVCPKCDKGVRTKVGYKEVDGKKVKVRLCTKCGAEI